MARPSLHPTPHDKLFAEAFGTVEAGRGMLRSVLPEALLARVDLDSLAPVPGTFVDEAMSGSQSDLLFSVRLAERPALVYILLEHKSYVDPWVPLQLARYIIRIWEQTCRTKPAPRHLPPVVPLVIYHGETGWTGATRLADIIDPVASKVPELAALTPRFEFLLEDLGQATDEQLLSRALGIFPTIAAIFLRDARSQERVLPMLRRVLALLRDLWLAPDGPRAVAVLLRYLCLVAEVDSAEVMEIVKQCHPEAEKLIMTIAEQLRQQGREEGRAEGQRLTLLKLLRLRFQHLPEDVLLRIEAADTERLDVWAERILTAESLEDVFE